MPPSEADPKWHPVALRLYGPRSVTRPISRPELTKAAALLRNILAAIPGEEDARRDALVRRRIEGAIAAAELAAGEDSPRTCDNG